MVSPGVESSEGAEGYNNSLRLVVLLILMVARPVGQATQAVGRNDRAGE